MVNYSVSDLLTAVLDEGTFQSWDSRPVAESVLTGEGRVGGRLVALAASDFSYQGGSIGLVAGERLARAAERATARGLPLVALPASGGTRMQEGTAAFLQMLKVTAAVIAHKAAGLPYLVYLRHPTTGGVLASWASLGQVTLAEPGALIGFLGPRACEALAGRPFGPGVQRAENLRAHGLIDAVVEVRDLASYLARLLAALPDRSCPAPDAEPEGQPPVPRARPAHRSAAAAEGAAIDGWESVTRTRQPGYPRGLDFLRAAATDVAAVGEGGGLLLALARVAGRPVVAGVQPGEGTFGIVGLELALRGIRLAADLRLPLVTVIDTPGAELSVAAEEGGIAGWIARCLEALVTLRVPTVSVLLGRGTGGGALALLPADRVLAAPHGWLAPLAPEGASAILHRDATHAPAMARAQGITAGELAAIGAVDLVAPVGGDPWTGLEAALARELAGLAAMDPRARLAARLARLRRLGT
ncbi:MAG TPA: carboxyl transferase domain-containing protein [Trebonia sp.]|nr:carboxyl transferase domain-containing protein [Trebonia sp.]